MISDNLQKAIDTLHIQDVYLRGMTSRCDDDVIPKYISNLDDLAIQLKHHVKESTVVELEKDSYLLLVSIDVGARWVNENEKDNSDSVIVQIEAEYIAEYAMNEELEKACIDEFSLKNASFHVWPYWRELLSNQCDRMRLPKVTVPTVQFASNHDVRDELKNKAT